ncbi:TIGR00282 family metallophosphoesterase [Breznakiella homolactica]|uniref:TIGR00282 family metallophosphoesterase n=1 Tax=Breznakiella homolactica TaxID=2798577 RepID=A0A7T7XPN3_9SPIR|nr:TIGR00282 family metallophosphoesterase [Breznakiella homolactica]QQO10181.1 TIGR00282 family metallophosphoesterase [Breznakiella homolactica]
MNTLTVMMIGDVVGDPGLEALAQHLPNLIKTYNADFIAVNGENAADGFGMTDTVFQKILDAGADTVTSGNHVWEKREFWPTLETNPQVIRPANYPPGNPGKGYAKTRKNGKTFIAVNIQGREFMGSIDCPFTAMDRLLESPDFAGEDNPVILVDFHAESTQEKEALALYLDGRVSLVAGTHTHVQTADERLLPKGTAYITDLGMTGAEESIIGMDIAVCLDRARTQVPFRMECAKGPAAIHGIAARIDSSTGKPVSIERIRIFT